MSVSQPKYQVRNNNSDLINEKISLANLVDNVNNNNLHIFYPKEDSLFKKKIDKLNLKFYLETEKYLSNQHNEGKCQDSLFIILFQQISLYIEEIERLNLILQEKKGDPKCIKERVDEYIRKQKDFETKERLIQTLKESKTNLEKKLSNLISHEDKIKSENDSLKRQNKFYQEQLRMYIQKDSNDFSSNNNNNNNNKNGNNNDNSLSIKLSKKISKKRNYSDNNPNKINLKNDVNVFRGGRYLINSVEHNKLRPKKELKIIKAVKEQLTRTASDDSKRCSSPNLQGIKTAILNCDNEMKELTMLEIYLKKFKNNIISETSIAPTVTLNPFDTNENHMRTEVIVSDLEDYDKVWKSNGFKEPVLGKKKNYTGSGLNSVTIDLDSSENETSLGKYGFHNNKVKTPHFKTINLTASSNEGSKNKKLIYK